MDAAWGMATYADANTKPYTIGFYDVINKTNIVKKITEAEITKYPDVYNFYNLGEIPLYPSCLIYGVGKDNKGWPINIQLGHLFSVDEPNAKYDAWVSLKFEGPAYSENTKTKPNRVLCDRVVLVKKIE